MAKPSSADHTALQRKIFTRWASQRLWGAKKIKVTDIVKDFSNPQVSFGLIETLSEKTYKGKIEKQATKFQAIANANNMLKFTFDECGVIMKNKPSAENIVDGEEKEILGLVFNLMMKFLKFQDDEDSKGNLTAKDALLLWVQNKTTSYNDVKPSSFKDAAHWGLTLCALIHKHRPKLIDFGSLNKDDTAKNIMIAMDAAEEYFGLEKYITVEEFMRLDDNSLFVYVSDYFYGIAEQRKIDQAARRIKRLIIFTKTTDALRNDYNSQADDFKNRLKKVEDILSDRSIDNTLSGARAKMDEFYKYKAEDKGVLLGLQLNLEGLYNNLALLLSNNKRPQFRPPSGLTLRDIDEAMLHLEKVEQERKVALQTELNRQLQLVELNKEHTSLVEKIKNWGNQKMEYLQTKEDIGSVGIAQFALKTLEEFNMELEDVTKTEYDEIQNIGKKLKSEKYEFMADVETKENDIKMLEKDLRNEQVSKKKYLDEMLQRELKKEELRIQFAHLAHGYRRWSTSVMEKAEMTTFGFDLEQVEKFERELAQMDSDIGDKNRKFFEACQKSYKDGEDMNVVHNDYTKLSISDIENYYNKVEESVAERKAKFDKELERQRNNDALCKEFGKKS